MIQTAYRFVLQLLTREGTPLAQHPSQASLEPVAEWALLSALRQGCRGQVPQDVTVSPIPDETRGLPYVRALRVESSDPRSSPPACVIPVVFFAPEARVASAALVQQGRLREGESFTYRVLAFARGPAPEAAPAGLGDFEEVAAAPALVAGRLGPLIEASTEFGGAESGLLPVFMPASVLYEVVDLAQRADGREVGGVLIGSLVADDTLPELGVNVTAQIPARHALSESDKLTFTPETWAAVEAALALRRSNEVIQGWWHTHPARHWCAQRQCTPEVRRACPLQVGHFSADDIFLHENVFAKAFHVALLMTVADDGFRPTLYGYDHGRLRRRGFRILAGDPAGTPAVSLIPPPPATVTLNPETHRETSCP